MRLLIYGGSFNPPHRGHVDALRTAAEQIRPDRILVIPAGIPPHKILAEGSPAAEDRLRLCRLAFSEIPGAEVSDLELRREGKSYTVDTLRELRQTMPEAELFFLVGTDMLLYMEQWHQFREIFDLCTLAALPRNEGELDVLRDAVDHLLRTYGEEVLLIPKAPLPMDSTTLRADLPCRRGRERLPESVYAEIVRLRLYGAQPDLDWLRERTVPYLKPTRVPHVRGCEQEAARLAALWGERDDLAAEAGILHDITKKLSGEEQLRMCEKYGIMTDTFEREMPSLLHARTGACLARELFGIGEEVFDAIAWHNTGRPGMSKLEKILWLADFTEPTRAFPGVDRIRELVSRDLDLALTEALEMTLEHVRRSGGTLHPRTEQTLFWLRSEDKET